MDYKGWLDLLRAGFKKCRLKTELLSKGETQIEAVDGIERLLLGRLPYEIYSASPEAHTVYKLTDAFGLKYRYMLIEGSVLAVGPYLSAPISEAALFEIGERNRISPKQQKYLAELYSTIPILEEACPLFIMLDTFLEEAWQSPSFAIVDLGGVTSPPRTLKRSAER